MLLVSQNVPFRVISVYTDKSYTVLALFVVESVFIESYILPVLIQKDLVATIGAH